MPFSKPEICIKNDPQILELSVYKLQIECPFKNRNVFKPFLRATFKLFLVFTLSRRAVNFKPILVHVFLRNIV